MRDLQINKDNHFSELFKKIVLNCCDFCLAESIQYIRAHPTLDKRISKRVVISIFKRGTFDIKDNKLYVEFYGPPFLKKYTESTFRYIFMHQGVEFIKAKVQELIELFYLMMRINK